MTTDERSTRPNPYAPPKETLVPSVSAHTVTSAAGLKSCSPLLELAIQHKLPNAYGLHLFQSDNLLSIQNKQQFPFITISNASREEWAHKEILERTLGITLNETGQSKGGHYTYYDIVGVDLDNPALKPSPLNDTNQVNIALSAGRLKAESQNALDILLNKFPDSRDPYALIGKVKSIDTHMDALLSIVQSDTPTLLPDITEDKPKLFFHDKLHVLLNKHGSFMDTWERGYNHPEQNDLNEKEKKQLGNAVKEMVGQYERCKDDINAGLHHLLYAQALQGLAIQKQMQDKPSGCLMAPVAIARNVINRVRGGRGQEEN